MCKIIQLTIAVLLLVGGTAGGESLPLYFDIAEGQSTGGPPYPLVQPTIVKSYDKASPMLMALPLEEVSLNYMMTPPEMIATMEAVDSGGEVGTAGTMATLTYYLDATSPAPPAEIELIAGLNITAPEGGGIMVSSSPPIFTESFFDVFFDTSLSDGKVLSHHLHGEIGVLGDDLPLESISLNSVVFEDTPAEAYDAYLTIQMAMGEVLTPGMPVPLMTIEMTGTYVPEPATAGLLLAGGLLAWLQRKRS